MIASKAGNTTKNMFIVREEDVAFINAEKFFGILPVPEREAIGSDLIKKCF